MGVFLTWSTIGRRDKLIAVTVMTPPGDTLKFRALKTPPMSYGTCGLFLTSVGQEGRNSRCPRVLRGISCRQKHLTIV